MNQLRCAVIGCGRIGCGFDDGNDKTIRTHAGSYFKNPATKLVALCDVDTAKLKKYGQKYSVNNLYTNSTEMFKKENLDCVSICTFLDTHLELIKEAAQYGVKGILVEKPLSNNLDDAKTILEICKKNKIILMIDFQRRFDPFYHSLKKMIDQKVLGDLQYVNVYYGSGIANTGSHIFDLIRFLFGEVISLRGNHSKNKSNNNLDPNIDIVVNHSNNLTTKINAINANSYGVFEMDIFGDRGRIRVNYAINTLDLFKPSKGLVYKNLASHSAKIKTSKQSSIYLGIKNLAECIKSRKKPLSGGENGYKSLELVVASIMSANKDKEIQIPLKPNKFIVHSR